jgi:hypothetical protein
MIEAHMKMHMLKRERGAVSIFVVVFSALFVTIITVSFVGLMIRGQQQALNADLSNSAYDAALAGVEDAKRMLLKYRQCLRTNSNSAECINLRNMFANPACNMVKRSATNFTDNSETEMLIESSDSTDTSSKSLDQAYTCVTVAYTADSKEVLIRDGESVLIPVDSAGTSYNKVSISWFTKDPAAGLNINLPTGVTTTLPSKTQWMNVGAGNTRPPVLRAQWIQHSASFNAADFDSDKTENFATVANTKALFLYPNSQVTSTTSFATDDRSTIAPSTKAPAQVYCSASFYNDGQYACTLDLDLPDPIGNTGVRTGYLNLGAIYNSTKVKVALKSNNDPIPIVAPTVDSTGRANDLFRRVKVGISFTGEYPRANFDITGNLCKDFAVSNTTDGYDPGSCNPNTP